MAVAQAPRKSQLSPASTATIDMNTTTRLNVVFAVNGDASNDIVEVHTIFNNDAEEEREIKSRVGYHTKFPRDVLNIKNKIIQQIIMETQTEPN